MLSPLASILLSAPLAGPPLIGPQGAPCTGFDYCANAAAIEFDYGSPAVAPSCLRRATLFTPASAPPPGGWPVVIELNNAGLTGTLDDTTEPIRGDNLPLHAYLDAGFAVMRASLTYSSPPGGDPCAGLPAQDPPGNGLFHPPGLVPSGLAAAPYDDPDYALAEKDVLMLVQHCRANAQALGLRSDAVALAGRSGAAIVGMWAAFGPDRAQPAVPGQPAQDSFSTRPDAAVFGLGSVFFPAYVQSEVSGRHFPSKLLGAPWTTPAIKLTQALKSYQRAASAVVYEDFAANEAQPAYLYYGAPFESTEFAPATPGGIDYVEGALSDIHSAWHGYAWQARHPATRLVLTDPQAVAPGVPGPVLIEDEGALVRDQIAYLADRLGTPLRYVDLGQEQLGGGPDSVVLGSSGRPQAGTVFGLAGADPGAFGLYLYGTQPGPLAVPGIVPLIGVAATGSLTFTTDSGGAHRVGLRPLPSVPGAEIIVQALFPTDPLDSATWRLSNTIRSRVD